MIRRPVRRLALATCAVLAAAGLSSCSTFSDSDAAARVGDVELSASDAQAFVEGNLELAVQQQQSALSPDDTTVVTAPAMVSGDQMRSFLSEWIAYAAIEQLLASEGLPVTDDDLVEARASVEASIVTDPPPPDELVDYAVWRQAVETKFGERTSTEPAEDYLKSADVYVDPFYGRWDPEQFTVVAFATGG